MNRLKGIFMILLGSMFWGATGPMMEWVLAHTAMTANFMLSVRLIIAGSILLLFLQLTGTNVLALWREKQSATQMLIFSVIGMLGLQFSFTKTIEESNAVVATLLQFVAPILIIIYVSIKGKQYPQKSQVIGMMGTLFGLFLLLTNGSISSLAVSGTALIWGMALAFTYAFYTLYPARLMNKWGVLPIVSWGIFLSGVEIAVLSKIWNTNEWYLLKDTNIILIMIGMILFGSAAYILFLASLRYISPVETSVLSSFEPVTATVISMIWLGLAMNSWQYIGMVLMLLFIIYLSVAGSKQQPIGQKKHENDT